MKLDPGAARRVEVRHPIAQWPHRGGDAGGRGDTGGDGVGVK